MKQWIAFFAAAAVLVITIGYNLRSIEAQAGRKIPAAPHNETAVDVQVRTVRTAPYRASLSLYGEATPHYAMTLEALVSGRIVEMSSRFEAGERVAQTQMLLQIDPGDYASALASAEADLADAKLAYAQADKERERARAEWQASGLTGEPDPLRLYTPQLEAAAAALEKANQAVAVARRDLGFATVTAPFDALVVSRNVAPGDSVQSATELATLYSTDYVEVETALSEREWSMLPSPEGMRQADFVVTLQGVESGHRYTGKVLRVQGYVQSTTRQRGLIIGVMHPFALEHPLYPGTFLTLSLTGKAVAGLWQLPPSSLSQSGQVWYVQDGVLEAFDADVTFSDPEAIYVKPPEALSDSTVAVLIHPLSGYTRGMRVNPVEATDE